MTTVMGDSTNPSDLPSGLGAYAGYDDGHWADYLAIKGEHPFVPVLEITVFLANQGVVLDIENGDATPPDAPRYVNERTTAGIWRPVLYMSRDLMPAVVGALNNARIPRAAYRLWSAHYGGGAHICGPSTCQSPVQADGTQWIDHGGWDESILADGFFPSPNPTPAPGPPPSSGTPYSIPGEAGQMNVDITFGVTGNDGTAYVDVPIPPGCTHCIGASVDVADPATWSPPMQDVDIRPPMSGERSFSGAVAQPCVGAQTAGHQRIRLAGGASQHFYTGHSQWA